MICLLLLIAWVHLGLGVHEEIVVAQNPLYLIQGARYFYVGILFFETSIGLPKISALFFYARVFSANVNKPILRLQLWVLGALGSGWLLTAWLVSIWQCDPIARAWNTTIPGKCVNTFAWYTATATISCAIDIWILAMPVPLIWRLNIPCLLLIAFFLTYSVIILSVGRMIVTIKVIPSVSEDETWRLPTYICWGVMEGSLSIISISVPNAIALVKHLKLQGHPKSTGIPSGAGSGESPNPASNYELGHSQKYASIHGGKRSIGENSDHQRLELRDQGSEMARGDIWVLLFKFTGLGTVHGPWMIKAVKLFQGALVLCGAEVGSSTWWVPRLSLTAPGIWKFGLTSSIIDFKFRYFTVNKKLNVNLHPAWIYKVKKFCLYSGGFITSEPRYYSYPRAT